MNTESRTVEAVVTGVGGNIISIHAPSGVIMKNEVANVCLRDEKLKSEVLRVQGDTADIQVFEETAGVKVGDRVELTGQLLSIALGPGLLGNIYDGLQIPLHQMAEENGFFLKRGAQIDPFDMNKAWQLDPACKPGDRLTAGGVLGTVAERKTTHKIMVPFSETGPVEVLQFFRQTMLPVGQASQIDVIAVKIFQRDVTGHPFQLGRQGQQFPALADVTASPHMVWVEMGNNQPGHRLAAEQLAPSRFKPLAGRLVVPAAIDHGKAVTILQQPEVDEPQTAERYRHRHPNDAGRDFLRSRNIGHEVSFRISAAASITASTSP